MMARIGVIDLSMIGQDYTCRLTQVLAGSDMVAVADTDAARAHDVAGGLSGANAYATGEELIAAPGVDTVLVCS